MTDMAIGEKYAPLGNWLKGHAGDSVKLTFDELNQIIPIPNHAYMNRPSWANLSSPASFCSSWISAGYVVDSISLEEQWVVFRKGEVQSHTHHHTVSGQRVYIDKGKFLLWLDAQTQMEKRDHYGW